MLIHNSKYIASRRINIMFKQKITLFLMALIGQLSLAAMEKSPAMPETQIVPLQAFPLDRLSNEIVAKIFAHCEKKAIASLRVINIRFNGLCDSFLLKQTWHAGLVAKLSAKDKANPRKLSDLLASLPTLPAAKQYYESIAQQNPVNAIAPCALHCAIDRYQVASVRALLQFAEFTANTFCNAHNADALTYATHLRTGFANGTIQNILQAHGRRARRVLNFGIVTQEDTELAQNKVRKLDQIIALLQHNQQQLVAAQAQAAAPNQ